MLVTFSAALGVHRRDACAQSIEAEPTGWNPFPWRYAFARAGARAYRTPVAAATLGEGPDVQRLQSGWGLAFREVVTLGGQPFVHTLEGMYVRTGELFVRVLSNFEGTTYEDLSGTEPGVPAGWVIFGNTRMYRIPGHEPLAWLHRWTHVHVYETQASPEGELFARIGPEGWVRANRVRVLNLAPPPAEVDVGVREHWIDIDLTNQTLVAYEGRSPVHVTLVSSGRNGFGTQPGVFRIFDRYELRTMDDLERTDRPLQYRLENVPYVQYFDGDRALHGVYWHGDFGTRRSHGCVNLSVRDAARMYRFTARRFPAGVTPPEGHRGGVLVRVREGIAIDAARSSLEPAHSEPPPR